MRIIDGYSKVGQSAVDTARQGTAASRAPQGRGGDADAAREASAEKVDVSPAAHHAAAHAEAAKIERLRSAISNGSFKVDHAAIAKKIVEGG